MFFDQNNTAGTTQSYTEGVAPTGDASSDIGDGLLISLIVLLALSAILLLGVKAYKLKRQIKYRGSSPRTPRRKLLMWSSVAGMVIIFVGAEMAISHMLTN